MKTLLSIFDGTAVYEKQPEESPTPYASMITKQMGLLDFTKSAEVLETSCKRLKSLAERLHFFKWKNIKSVEKPSGMRKKVPLFRELW